MHKIQCHRAARRALHAALAGVLALAATSVYAEAPPEQTAGSIEYRVGGIGADEAEAMRRLSSDYPLTLTFVERSADGRDMYTADVGVSITDSSGAPQLTTQAQGPMLLADLPDGSYTVEATLGGETKTQQVAIADGKPQRVVFVWTEQASEQLSRVDR